MAWIESHDTLKDHPKTRRAARALGVSIPTMMGHLHLLWHWCLQYAEDGDLSGYDYHDIADAMMWDGDPDALIDALLDCGPGDRTGFLEHLDDKLVVHDWMDYAGALVEARKQAREDGARGNHERWHVRRGIIDPNCPYCAESQGKSRPESQDLSGGESGGDADPNRVLSHRTVPYPTIPNQKRETDRVPAREPVLEPDPLPEPFASMSVGQSSSDDLTDPHDDMALRDVADRYQHRIGIVGGRVMPTLDEWHTEHGLSYGVMAAAVDMTAEVRADGRIRGSPDGYLFGVIRGLYNDGVRTVTDLQAKQRADPRGGYDEAAAKAYLDEVLGRVSDDDKRTSA